MKSVKKLVESENWAYVLHVKNAHLYIHVLKDQKKKELMKQMVYVNFYRSMMFPTTAAFSTFPAV